MAKPLYPQFNLDVQTFYPKCKVVAYSDWGALDLTDDVRMVTTHKSLGELAGVWAIQLVERPRRNGLPPYAYLRPMDYIEIELWNAPRQEHYYMRGFIENIQRVFSTSYSGVIRYTQLNGHDMATLLLKNHVRYIWQIDPASMAGNPYMLDTNYGIGMDITTPDEFMEEVFDKIVNGLIMGYQKERIPNIPSFSLITDVPSQYRVNRFTINNFTGPISNFLNYYITPPFLELFYVDKKEGPFFYVRQPPLTDYDGNELGVFDVTHDNAKFPPVTVPMSYLKDFALGKSANEMYCFYFVYSDIASMNQQAGYGYFSFIGGEASSQNFQVEPWNSAKLPSVGLHAPSNPTYDKEIEITYGFNPLIISTPLISDPTNMNNADFASKMCRWLYKANQENWRFESGTLLVHGDGQYQIGQYITIKDFGTFYIESVDHQLIAYNNGPGNKWMTTLGVTRGRRAK